MILNAFPVLLCLPLTAAEAAFPAALASPSNNASRSGYVVKVDSNTIYLDLGESSGAAVGQEFIVFVASAELKHPVTGESLGFLETPVARGRIEQILPKYSIGRPAPDSVNTALPIAVGQRARLVPQPAAAAAPASAPQAAAPSESGSHQPLWRSPLVDFEAVDMAVADIDGDGKPEIILAAQNRIEAYPYIQASPPPSQTSARTAVPGDLFPGAKTPAELRGPTYSNNDWKLKCSFQDNGTGIKFLSVDAMDLNGNGKAAVFATFQNTFFNRIETHVLECKDGRFEKLATLPWVTRAYEDASGIWHLAAQQLIDDSTFPFGNIFSLEFKDGKYIQSSSALRLKRVDWAYGFAMAQDPVSKEPFHLFYTPTNYIRAQFSKGSWSSPESYGQTSSRVRWRDRPLMFYPRLVLAQSSNEIAVYTVKNIPSFGALAGAFGLYGNAELHKLRWTGLSLEEAWKADLGGYAADLIIAKPNPVESDGLFVAVVSKTGKTSVWKFAP